MYKKKGQLKGKRLDVAVERKEQTCLTKSIRLANINEIEALARATGETWFFRFKALSSTQDEAIQSFDLDLQLQTPKTKEN